MLAVVVILVVTAALRSAGAAGALEGAGATAPATPRALRAPASFAMMSLAEQVAGGGELTAPPDTHAAANATNVVEVVNSTLNVYDRSTGARTGSQIELASLLSPPSGYRVSDPRVIYDAPSHRWIVSAMSFKKPFSLGQGGRVHLATSDTDDPAGSWHAWTVRTDITGVLFDQPRLGLTSDKVLLAWDDFSGSDFASFDGAEALVVEKDDVYSGALVPRTASQTFPSSGPAVFALVPAENQSAAATGWFVHNETDLSPPRIGVITVTGTPAGGDVAFSSTSMGARRGSTPPPASQSGSAAEIDTGDVRFLNAVWRGGRLWTGGSDACRPSGDTATRACGRLVQIDTTGASPAVVQDFDFGTSGASTMFPSVTFNGLGDLAVGYSTSSSAGFGSFAAGGQLRSDANRLSSTLAVKAGGGVYDETPCFGPGPSRWGDYGGASMDPSSDLHAWVAGEYAVGSAPASTVPASCNWGTWATRVTFAPPAVTATAVASTAGGGVTVTGDGFTPATTATVDGSPVAVTVTSSQQLTLGVAPHAAGSVPLVVTTEYGTSAAASLAYQVPPPPPPPPPPPRVAPDGYRFVAADGGIFAFGDAAFAGSAGGSRLNLPIVGMAGTPSGGGYWLVGSDGGIFAFGDAAFFGSTGNVRLNRPIVAMAPTPDGLGYWLVASDGGIFAFGDAGFFGSTGAITLNKPIVAMAATPSGSGYWLVASDGGIFAFGDAAFFGSTGSISLNQPIVTAAATPSGLGYWLVASDGGVFAFGDAGFFGSTGSISLNQPIVGMAPTATGQGYRFVASDGGVFSFGDASFLGSTGAIRLNSPIVGMTAL